jgi:hypothetical protein
MSEVPLSMFNTQGSYECDIKPGFSAFNTTAGQDINECLSAGACNRSVSAHDAL